MTTILDSNNPPSDSNKINIFEQEHGISLPADYRAFLRLHNGGKPLPDVVTIPDCSQKAIIDHFLGLGRESEDLEDWMNELREDMPQGFIPIGFDPGGNAILLDLSDGVIYYWDSARFFDASTDDENTYWVANSFEDLIKSLKSED